MRVPKTYLALTVGPIYGTIQSAKKVRELFGASYFFSWFMRHLLIELRQSGNIDIAVPYIGESGELLGTSHNIGFFHDRFVAVSSLSVDEARNQLKKAQEKALQTCAEKLRTNGVDTEALKAYLVMHPLVIEKEELAKIDKNPLIAIDKLLDAKELHYPFAPTPSKTFVYTCTPEEKDKFGAEEITDLSPVNLFGYKIHTIKREIGLKIESFRSTHDLAYESGYFVVVTADGDKMGAKIRELMGEGGNVENIRSLSKNLYRFFFENTNIRALTNDAYGGELIFAGGDDILALLPVRHGSKTFLDYLDELSKRFKAVVGDEVSLSFGVNIVYYKYPMKNAISEAFTLLKEAKDWGKRPNIAKIQLVKHSGQKYDTLHALSEPAFATLDTLVKGTLAHKDRTRQKQPCEHTDESPCFALPHAVHHTLDLYKGAIVKTLEDGRSLEPFFEKIFDDARTDAQKRGLRYLQNHIEALRPVTKEDFYHLFGDLNIVKFLRGDRDDLPA
ncbi:type III-B CRISPR-associated protein Cas10/Cmr2 [Hydrogenimonas sp.]